MLKGLGNYNPRPGTVNFLLGWMQHESGGSLANGCFNFNPLSVARSSLGSTPSGCGAGSNAGVNSFPSYDVGVQATVQRLHSSYYTNIRNALQTNDEKALGMTGVPSSGIIRDLSNWVDGPNAPINPGYVNSVLAAAGSSFVSGSANPNNTSTSQGEQSQTQTNEKSGSTSCAPWDIACLFRELVVSEYFQRSTIVLVGLLLLLIGVVVLFIPHEQQAMQTAAKAAA